jgi:predicted glycosyltransferase
MCRIAGALRRECGPEPPFAPLLLTGHKYAAELVPAGCEFIRLPLVPETGLGETARQSDDWPVAPESAAILRREIIESAVRAFAPDVILADHMPAGKNAEMLKSLKEHRGSGSFVFRGVTGASEIKRGILAKAGAAVLRDHYKNILVVCDRRICDVAAEHGLPAELAARVNYCGYLVEDIAADRIARIRRERGLPEGAAWVVCSAGGGWNGAGMLAACSRLAESLTDLYFDLVVGPKGSGWPPEQLPIGDPDSNRVRVRRSTSDLDLLHAACDLVICSGGYNSLVEAMAGRTPVIVSPSQPDPADEQCLHARRLSDFYPVALALDTNELEAAVRRCVPALDRLRRQASASELAFDGLATVRRIVQDDLSADPRRP